MPEVSLLVAVPPQHRGRPVDETLGPVVRLFESRWPDKFEVIIVEREARGLALLDAFSKSRGRIIMTLHPEQPCDPGFFMRAYDEIANGADLVRANRRMNESRFRIPVSVLPKVYARHRYGLAFNRLVRTFLPIETRDTSAGNLVMKRETATVAFALQSEPGFLFDLEIALIATDRRFVQRDLPERLLLYEEKTVARIGSEIRTIFFGLPKLWWRHLRGYYRAHSLPRAITADDWGISPGVNRGIVELARAGIVRRVSMLAGAPFLRECLDELLRLDVQAGLHFNLTFGTRFRSPGQFMFRWLMSTTLRDEVRDALRRQLDTLEAAGVRVAYLDGHHHVHIVPGVVPAIADILKERGIEEVRLPYDPALWLTSLAPLNVLSLLARRDFHVRGLRHRRFIYPRRFDDLARLAVRIGNDPDAEVIVHPAAEDDFAKYAVADPYSADRVTEFRALMTLPGIMELPPRRD